MKAIPGIQTLVAGLLIAFSGVCLADSPGSRSASAETAAVPTAPGKKLSKTEAAAAAAAETDKAIAEEDEQEATQRRQAEQKRLADEKRKAEQQRTSAEIDRLAKEAEEERQLAAVRAAQEKKKKELSGKIVSAESGGGLVTVKMNGEYKVLGIQISKDIVNSDDVEMLQDLIVAAINLAQHEASSLYERELGGIASMMPKIPGLNL